MTSLHTDPRVWCAACAEYVYRPHVCPYKRPRSRKARAEELVFTLLLCAALPLFWIAVAYMLVHMHVLPLVGD